MKTATLITATALVATLGASATAQDNDVTTAALAELAQRQAEDARIAKNLETFDMIDFEVFQTSNGTDCMKATLATSKCIGPMDA